MRAPKLDGALLIHKDPGITSFGIIGRLQAHWKANSRIGPKMGHGGTLDPFATGLIIVLVGRGVKLARYFLGSSKTYEGIMRFGETTIPGDITAPISQVSEQIPASLEKMRELAQSLTNRPYFQTPPMHSAKKKNGRALYELARKGIEVDREPKQCLLMQFDIETYEAPRAKFRVECSSGTYIRTLAQDFAEMQGSVALLETLHRTHSGAFSIENAWTLDQLFSHRESTQSSDPEPSETLGWEKLPCWVPFDRLLDSLPSAQASESERIALTQGKQEVLLPILQRASLPGSLEALESREEKPLAIYCNDRLIGVARKDEGSWSIERVFPEAL